MFQVARLKHCATEREGLPHTLTKIEDEDVIVDGENNVNV